MRIGLISTLATPVRADGGGSIENHVALLARHFTRLGHHVTVFAAAGSEVDGELIATLPGVYGSGGAPADWHLCEWINICAAAERSERFDLLHSHAYLWGMPVQRLIRTPMVHTLHLMPDQSDADSWALHPDAPVIAISAAQWKAFPHLRPTGIVHHGIEPSAFAVRDRPDVSTEPYLLYLGRFTPGKGVVDAIDAARRAGMAIQLAGPENDYFRKAVAQHVDGRSVRYVGPADPALRASLLAGASALLFTVREPEPFGLVMIEAMMSGTPVVALNLGAVPELVDDGLTGCIASSADDLPRQIARAMSLDRRTVRKVALRRFSAARMASEYVALYERVLKRPRSEA